MVRLEWNKDEIQMITNSKFQFLNGAIRIYKFIFKQQDWNEFQFLNGAIRIKIIWTPWYWLALFQFLNGAIRIQH